ncbi:MAG: DOMON domain-containing protein [Candidatus Aegiribacteria sp.]
MKIILILAGALTLLLFFSGCENNPFDPDGWSTETCQDFTLRWRVSGSDLQVELEGPSTGWVAVGFAGSYMMHDANIIVGAVSGSSVNIRDDFGIDANTHVSDSDLQGGQQNVWDKSGSQDSESTTISFTTPLDSGDLYDNVLSQGQSCSVVFVCGEDGDDNLDSGSRTIVNTSITI